MFPCICNLNKPGTKTVVPGSIPRGTVSKPNLGGSQSQHHLRRIRTHPRIRIPSIHLQLRQTGDEKLRVDTAQQGVETPIPPADCWSTGFVKPPTPGYNAIPSSIEYAFFYLGLQLIEGQSEYPAGRYCAARCGTLTAGTPLLFGVHEAGCLHPLGARRLSKLVCHYLTDLQLLIVK